MNKKTLLAACLASMLFPIWTASQSAAATPGAVNPNDEGLTDPSLFPRRLGAPYVRPAAPEPYVQPVELAFDESGRSSELIVTLAYSNKQALRQIVPTLSDAATRQIVEMEVVKAVRSRERVADLALQNPVGAEFLTEDGRLPDASRAMLAADHPRELLEQYLILRYPSVAAAVQAEERLKSSSALASVANNRRVTMSWAPNDPYFAVRATAPLYQWGLREMNLQIAWDQSTGHGYIGVIEAGVPNDLNSLPPDVLRNHRPQMAYNTTSIPAANDLYHTSHVLGILSATANNGIGIAGACPTCSTALMKVPSLTASRIANAMNKAIERGMQVVNWSGGWLSFYEDYPVCGANNDWSRAVAPICNAIDFGHRRKVMIFSAAGNGETELVNLGKPQFPGEHPSVVAVAGAEERYAVEGQLDSNCFLSYWCQWRGEPMGLYPQNRTNAPGINGMYAPARSIVSTVAVGSMMQGNTSTWDYIYRCADASPYDESGTFNDGYGSCTGTSMATPHLSALAGILRSINPLLPALPTDHNGQAEPRTAIRTLLHNSGSHQTPSARWGHGMPDAAVAVADTVAQTANRLTPLFAFYSSGRYDYLYTTVPQMATAALAGFITPDPCAWFPCSPWYASTGGTTVTGYAQFPDAGTESTSVPRAEVWIFTTPQNPKNSSIPLVPLYRFSWRCGDPTPYPPAVCSSNSQHTDSAYSADPINGIGFFESAGYRLDGIEGYIYPRTMAQPAGTVRLMRKYNPTLDDHAIFPETRLAAMLAAGYTDNTGGTDWIGYVYPNIDGNVPAIQ